MRLLTHYVSSMFSKVGHVTSARALMVFRTRKRALWYVFCSAGTGTIATATACMWARAGPEGKGDYT